MAVGYDIGDVYTQPVHRDFLGVLYFVDWK